MKFLICCEFYYPSLGGVQEVMRRVAEGLVNSGHQVTIATSSLDNRAKSEHNGVQIKEFKVWGNRVQGISGEVENYIQFVKDFKCDALLIKAAQQWTFDALWSSLDDINTRKYFIPCGFSGLYEPIYKEYFKSLPKVMSQFDGLIFYSTQYRDYQFAKTHGCKNLIFIPNGASSVEFLAEKDEGFRDRLGIPKNSFVLLTVGSLTGAKGHRELAEAFYRIKASNRHITLLLNGNIPESNPSITNFLKIETSEYISDPFFQKLTRISGKKIRRIFDFPTKCLTIICNDGMIEFMRIMKIEFQRRFFYSDGLGINYWINKIGSNTHKKIILTNLDRKDLVNAYKNSNLFVFASNIEYSPLVLFEAAAAGLPFISTPVGNAEEIANWTKGGFICPATSSKRGYTYANPKVLALNIEKLISSNDELVRAGISAHEMWNKYFTWEKIIKMYEVVLMGKELRSPFFLRGEL